MLSLHTGVPSGQEGEFEQVCPQLDPAAVFAITVLWHQLRLPPVAEALRLLDRAHVALLDAARQSVRGNDEVLEGTAQRTHFLQQFSEDPLSQRVFLAERAASVAFDLCRQEAEEQAARAIVAAGGMHGPVWTLVQVAALEEKGSSVPARYRDTVDGHVRYASHVLDSRDPSRAVDLGRLLAEGTLPDEVGLLQCRFGPCWYSSSGLRPASFACRHWSKRSRLCYGVPRRTGTRTPRT